MEKILYRADFDVLNHSEAENFSEQIIGVVYHEHKVLKETPSGYWIERKHKRKQDKPLRFVLKDQSGKRFAYITKERALEGFYFRRMRYKHFLNRMVKNNERLIGVINEEMKNFNTVS